jgi:transcriptional regulator with XRE-family HTH domain
MATKFNEWLIDELKKRGWSMREAARHGPVSHTSIAQVINEERDPTLEFCMAMAEALDYSREYILRKAGILDPLPDKESDPTLSKWLEIGHTLTPEQREEAIRYAIWAFKEERHQRPRTEEVDRRGPEPANPALEPSS